MKSRYTGCVLGVACFRRCFQCFEYVGFFQRSRAQGLSFRGPPPPSGIPGTPGGSYAPGAPKSGGWTPTNAANAAARASEDIRRITYCILLPFTSELASRSVCADRCTSACLGVVRPSPRDRERHLKSPLAYSPGSADAPSTVP